MLTRLETSIFVRQSSRSYTRSDRRCHLILFERNSLGNFTWTSLYIAWVNPDQAITWFSFLYVLREKQYRRTLVIYEIKVVVKWKKSHRYLLHYLQRKKRWLTWMPAKNGSSTAFEGDHTFFGDVVNFAETLHDIC